MAARISFVLLIFAAIAAAQTPGRKNIPKPPAAQPAQQKFLIDSILIEGNRILSTGTIKAALGLKGGEKGDAEVFDAARDRLLATGYFETVGYLYQPSQSGGYEVTFEVQEVSPVYPIRVEALPATTAEVTAFLKSKDPLFGGQMPGTKEALSRTSAEIEQYLATKNYTGKVTGKVAATAPEQFEIEFMPERGVPAVAKVEFENTKVISATELHNKFAEVAFGQPYTETEFRALLDSQIRPLYDGKGYLHVTFPKITTERSSLVDGIDVTVTVDEGAEYKLARVAVAGSGASDSARILKAAKIPQMTIADFDQIKQAAVRVKDAMRHQGYLDAMVTTDRKLDDVKKTAEFFLVVDPGPQYKFGKLIVSGLDLNGEDAIRKMWTVKSGDPYPGEYPDYFLAQVKDEGLFDNLGETKAVPKIDPNTHVVDVTLDFKGAPPKEKQQRPGPG